MNRVDFIFWNVDSVGFSHIPDVVIDLSGFIVRVVIDTTLGACLE